MLSLALLSRIPSSLLPASSHQRLMAVHAKYSLRGTGIAEVIDLALAVATLEASGAKGLVASQDSHVLDLVPTGTAAVGAIVTDQRSITKHK